MFAFEADKLCFSYERGGFHLRNVSITVRKGELVGIVGESGSGKSTLARLLSGLLKPQAGTISLDGNPLSLLSASGRLQFRRTVQMVFQDPDMSLPRHLPVRVPLHDAARLAYRDKRLRQSHIDRLLRELHLPEDTCQRRPRELSGGQRQRVAIARAAVVSPKILILDEPTSALDPSVQNEILRVLQKLRTGEGMAQLMITHDIALALASCHRLYVMHEGVVVEHISSTNAAAHPYTRRLLAAIPSNDPSLRRLITAG